MLAQQGIHIHLYKCIHSYTHSSTDVYVKKDGRQVDWGVFLLCLKGHCVRGGKLTMHFSHMVQPEYTCQRDRCWNSLFLPLSHLNFGQK